jgi:hypothetical protein
VRRAREAGRQTDRQACSAPQAAPLVPLQAGLDDSFNSFTSFTSPTKLAERRSAAAATQNSLFVSWLAKALPAARDRLIADPRFLFKAAAELMIDSGEWA